MNCMKKIGRLTTGFIIILGLFYFSSIIVKITHIGFPPTLLGLILFTILLHYKIIKEKFVEDICDLLLNNMTLFFVPLLVGITLYTNLISKNLWAILITIFISTTLTMVLSAFFVQNIIKYIKWSKK